MKETKAEAYHARLDGAGLDTTDGHRANSTNLVDVLKGKTKGFVGGTGWWVNVIDGFQKGLAGNFALGLFLPALVPWAVGGDINHVVAVEARDWHEWYVFGVVANLLDEGRSFLDDFLVPIFRPFGGVHLVDADNDLPDTESVGKEGVLTSLTVFGDTGLELTGTGSDDENGAVGL